MADRERFSAALLFRVGRSDETLRTAGVTHLVEHLALPPTLYLPKIRFNGTVDATNTVFWVEGDRERALEFLTQVGAGLMELPVARLERERTILMTEADSRGGDGVTQAAALRFGPHGYGLLGFEELGLHWLEAHDVQDWAASRFTRANAVLLVEGEPPSSDFGFELPDAPRPGPPVSMPLDYIPYPSVYPFGAPGQASAAMVVDRTHEIMAALSIAEIRLQDRLRHRAGLSYEVSWAYFPMNSEQAHVVIWCDGMESNPDLVRSNLLAVLYDLAEAGPTAQELEISCDRLRVDLSAPDAVPGRLFGTGGRLLDGLPTESDEDLLAARERLTSDQVSQALSAGLDTLLLLLPFGSTVPAGRFTPYPYLAPTRAEGRTHKPRTGFRFWRRAPERLLVGRDAVTIEAPDLRTTVRFDECLAAMRWPSGGRTLWSSDGFVLQFIPEDWRGGLRALEAIDERTPREAVITTARSLLHDEALERGAELMEEGRHEEAVRSLRDGLERRPEVVEGWLLLAACALELRRPADALNAARRAAELDPHSAASYGLQGMAAWMVGDIDAAVSHTRTALQHDPADLETLSTAAWILGENGFDTEAARAADRALELYPDSAEAWLAHGLAADARGDFDEGERGHRRALELAPGDGQALNNLGYLLLARGRTRAGLTFIDRALQRDATQNQARWNRALALGLLGRDDEARRQRLETAQEDAASLSADVEANPTSADSRVALARYLRIAGQVDEAIAHLQRAIEGDPQSESALLELAQIETSRGRSENAHRHLERAGEVAPASLETLYASAWLYAGTGEVERAVAAARKAEELFPHHPRAREAVGYAAFAEGRLDDADERFVEILERQPLRCCSTVWRGLIASARGDVGRARELALRGQALSHECDCAARARLLEETRPT